MSIYIQSTTKKEDTTQSLIQLRSDLHVALNQITELKKEIEIAKYTTCKDMPETKCMPCATCPVHIQKPCPTCPTCSTLSTATANNAIATITTKKPYLIIGIPTVGRGEGQNACKT